MELTTERQDLTKELADLNGGLEEAEAQREKEAGDFEEAEAELQQAGCCWGASWEPIA